MTFIEEFEAELAQKLESGADKAAIVSFASKKLFESYRNGFKMGIKQAEMDNRRNFPSDRDL
jgi:hypothetical protein